MIKIDFGNSVKKLLDDYGPDLACAGGVACLGLALYSAFKASRKVVEAQENYKEEIHKLEEREAVEDAEVAAEQHAKKAHKLRIARDIDYIYAYKWALIFGCGSAFLTILSRKLSGAKIAALGTALAMSEEKLKKLGKKLKDSIGEEELSKIKQEIRQEMAEEHIPEDKVPFRSDPLSDDEENNVPGNEGALMSSKLIYDDMTGTMFEIEENLIPDWRVAAQDYFDRFGKLDYNKFRSMAGLEECRLGSGTIWDKDHPYEGFTIEPMKWHDKWVGSIVFKAEPSTHYLK
jgi:hypothetical protein